MTKTGFVLANLFHKKTRTWLTLLSVVMAFVLFGLLQSLNLVFSASPDFIGATRLVTQSRVSFTQSLPMRMVPEMDAIPGVQRVMYQQWFGAVFRENPQIFAFAVDPERLHDVYPEWVMPEEHWNAFRDTRTGMIAGRLLAEQYGWKVGDKIPLQSNIFPQKNGSKDWTFDLVGIYDGKDDQWQQQTAGGMYINHAYFAEATQFGGGNAGIFVLRLEDPDMAESVAMAVDKRYENSADETKTQTEKDFQVGFLKQLGDIGLIVRWILFAVFFTLLLVVGNTMAQSVRERVPQFAVLKTLGFSDNSVLGFVLAETVALCAIGGLLGLSLATLLGAGISKAAGPMMPVAVDGRVWLSGVIAIVVLSVVVGLLPALRARRLKIVDALAGR
ncbi:ABC transporter permease [Arenimonas sp.]|uniref:ABC transporter permease n=1 Tax=Arenimonas sp. TaxID=1872635 RepID=UPI0025C16847|nr:ABC transporter permease [Arenimonas sp.]